jgi:hypothetical protein
MALFEPYRRTFQVTMAHAGIAGLVIAIGLDPQLFE